MLKETGFPNTISTTRLYLEEIRLEDVDFIEELVNTKGWLENIGDRNIHSKNEATTYIHKILRTENLIYWVVRKKESHTPVGIVSFMKRNYLENFDIGFAFLPDFQQQGYAYEASSAVLVMIAGTKAFDTILATTIHSNKKSIRLLTKLGFHFEREIEEGNLKLSVYANSVHEQKTTSDQTKNL